MSAVSRDIVRSSRAVPLYPADHHQRRVGLSPLEAYAPCSHDLRPKAIVARRLDVDARHERKIGQREDQLTDGHGLPLEQHWHPGSSPWTGSQAQ